MQPDGKDQQQVNRHDERRHRYEADRHNPQHPINPPPLIDDRDHAKRYPQHQRPSQCHDAKDQGVGKRLSDLIQHGAFGPDIHAQIAV